jgi:hypothetical protein
MQRFVRGIPLWQRLNDPGCQFCPYPRTDVRLLNFSALRLFVYRATLLMLLTAVARHLPAQGVSYYNDFDALPDAPLPQTAHGNSLPLPPASGGVNAHSTTPDKKCEAEQPVPSGNVLPFGDPPLTTKASCAKKFDIFYPIGKPPASGRLSSMDKLRIGVSNVVDPFNLATIGISAAITIGSDADTAYGPGMKGWAKNAGTLLTEDMTGTFFVTFLVPSIVRQDPRYYRMPHASVPRRIENAMLHPVWSKSDNGNPMPNLANFIGIPMTIAIANIYVPGRKQGVGPTAESSAIAIASAPIDSLTTEFLPDVAKHFKIRIVLIQQIVNHIAITGGQE